MAKHLQICPFCRVCICCNNIIVERVSDNKFQVVCHDCGARGSIKGTKKSAIKNWNQNR